MGVPRVATLGTGPKEVPRGDDPEWESEPMVKVASTGDGVVREVATAIAAVGRSGDVPELPVKVMESSVEVSAQSDMELRLMTRLRGRRVWSL